MRSVQLAFMLILALPAACEKKSEPTSGAPAGAQPAGPSDADVVITGTVAVSDLPAGTLGEAGIPLEGQLVEAHDANGAVVARSYTADGGNFAVIVPGTMVIDGGAALTTNGLTLQSVVADTGDDSVIGFRQPITAPVVGRVASLGEIPYAKVTAIRGRVRLENGTDHTGIAVYVPGTSYAARTDAAGEFLMTFVPAGVYDLRFERDGYLGLEVTGIAVLDGETSKVPPEYLKMSGGSANVSVAQVGAPGRSQSRTVEFRIGSGTADRFKAGLPEEIESKPYGPVPETFTKTFEADGTYELRFVFADADGFESTISRVILVDTVAPAADQVRLADRKSLDSGYTNERQVLVYHPTCGDIAAVAVLPAGVTAPADSDFVYECFTLADDQRVGFSIPVGTPEYSYKIWVQDVVGNRSPVPTMGSIVVDATPPPPPSIALRDQTSGSSLGSDITTVDISIGSCAEVKAVLVSESQLLPPRPSQFTMACTTSPGVYTYTFANNIPGPKTVLAWSIDPAGNVGQVSSTLSLTLDPVPPTVPTFVIADPTPANAGYSNSATLRVSPSHCNDVTHLLAREGQASAPSENDPGWKPCTTLGVEFSASGEGSKTFHLWARDVGGNVSATSSTQTITIDTTPPVAPALTLRDRTNYDQAYTNEAVVEVLIASCGDVDKIYLSQTPTPPTASAFSDSCSKTGTTFAFGNVIEESKTVYLWVRDLSGNVSVAPASDAITVDVTAPALPGTLAVTDPSNGSETYTNETTLAFAIDVCPPGAKLLVSEGQSSVPSEAAAFADCSTSGTVALTGAPFSVDQGLKSLYLWVRDQAGNVSSTHLSDTIIFDDQAPTPPILSLADQSGGAASGYTDSLTVAVTVGSCADLAKILLSESSAMPAESSVTTACSSATGAFTHTFTGSDGMKTLYLWFKDEAGNVNGTSQSIVYDSTTPTVTNTPVITSLGTDLFTLSYETDESIPSRVAHHTASHAGAYLASNYPSMAVVVSPTSAHAPSVTNLTANTQYFYRAVATDYAEHTSAAPEQSVRTVRLTTVFHGDLQAKLAGFINDSDTKRMLASCDVNADGRDDLIVGAPNATTANGLRSGAVYVVFGTSLPPSNVLLPTQADITYLGSGANKYLGGVGCVDFNGDGQKDLFMMETDWTTGAKWFLVYGGSGLATGTRSAGADTDETVDFGQQFTGVAFGNFDGDASGDIAINTNGIVKVYYGRPEPAGMPVQQYLIQWPSASIHAGLAAADVDGDGRDDLIMSNLWGGGENALGSYNGMVIIQKGSATRPTSNIDMDTWSPSVHPMAYEIHGASDNMVLGRPAAAGSIDEDAFADIILNGNGMSGDLYIVFGRPASGSVGLDWADDPYIQVSTNGLRFSGMTYTGYILSNQVVIRDVNADGKGDVVIGDRAYASGLGRTCLFLGRTQAEWASLGPSIPFSAADLCVTGADSGDQLGASVAVGNLDGVGNRELLFGAPAGRGSTDTGTANGEVGVLYWSLPSSYRNVRVDMGPHF